MKMYFFDLLRSRLFRTEFILSAFLLLGIASHSPLVFAQCATPSLTLSAQGNPESDDYTMSFATSGGFTDIHYTCNSIWEYVSTLNVGYRDLTSTYIISKNAGSSFSFTHAFKYNSSSLKIWVDWNKDGNFIESESVAAVNVEFGSTSPSMLNGTVTIPSNIAPGDYVMRMRSNQNQVSWAGYPSPCGNTTENGNLIWKGSTLDFTLRVVPTPSCYPITDLVETTHTSTSATLSWTATSGATSYNIKWGVPGFDPTTTGLGTTTSTTNSAVVSGLTPNTSYDIYVQANCGGTISLWVEKLNVFTGHCVPQYGGIYQEWHGYRLKQFKTVNALSNINYTSTSDSTYVNRLGTTLQTYPGNSVHCTFESNIGTPFAVFIDWNNDLDFDDPGEKILASPTSSPYANPYSAAFVVPTTATIGTYVMRVSGAFQNDWTTSACGEDAWTGSWIDFSLQVVATPTCKPVQAVTFGTTTLNSTSISWTAQNGETAWNVQWGTQGFAIGSGTTQNVNGTPNYTINGLAPFAYYDVYVQANCGGSTSAWAGPYSVYIGHCIPVGLVNNASNYLKGFKTYDATGNIAFTTNSALSWSDNPTNILTTYEGNVVGYELAYTAIANYQMWVDWNNDLDFDDPGEEILAYTNAYTPTYSGTFTIPVGTAPGNYKLRIAANGTSTATTPCGSLTHGNFTDFVINVQSATAPSCLPVVHPVNVQATSSTSIAVNWTASNGETAWNVQWGTQGFTIGSGTTVATTIPNRTINNLTANTYYDVYVQANCGSGNTSGWAGPYTVFMGPCLPAPYAVSSTHPLYINQFTTSGATQNISYNLPGNAHPGSYVDQTSTVLITAPNTQINFTIGSGRDGRKQTIWADLNNDFDFDDPGEMLYTNQTSFYVFFDNGHFIVPASTASGDYRLRVMLSLSTNPPTDPLPACGSNLFNTVDFTLRVVSNSSACNPPILLSATASSTSTIDLSWTAGGSETQWEIEWGNAGFTPGTNAQAGSIIVNTNSYTISNVPYGTAYDVYVRALCIGNQSTWTTHPTITIQPCIPHSFATNNDYTSSFSTTGATINASYGPVTQNATLGYADLTSSQTIALDAGMSFNFSHTYVGGSNVVRIWVDWNQDLIFTDDEEVYAQHTTWPTYQPPWDLGGTITVPAYQPAGNYVMRVRSRLSNEPYELLPCESESWSTAIDVILQVTGTTACPPILPLSLSATTTSFSTADVSWTAQGTESSWNIKWGAVGFNPQTQPGSGNATSSTNAYSMTALAPNATYDIYVQANCGSDQSIWTGPVTITTAYCTPTATFSENYYINGFSTDNALANINYTANSGVAYVDASATTIQSYVGNAIDYTISASSYIGYYYIWVDWNKDLDFDDAGELMYASPFDNINSSLSNVLTIPSGTPNGTYRMRVAHSETSNNLTACGEATFGNIVDFSLTINPTPTCMPVNLLTVTSTAQNSATLSWSAQGSETMWDIEYGITGFSQGSGTITSSPTTTTIINGLSANTSYDFYVRANCGNEQSIWIGPVNTFTGQCIPTGLQASTTYFVGSFVSTQALENINYTATSPVGYVNQTASQITVEQGAVFNYTIAQNTGQGRYFIWIDWNKNLDFDDPGETILSTPNYLASASGIITVPANITVGTYRMRVANSSLGDIGSCGPSPNGNYVDFTVNVISCTATNIDAGTILGDGQLCLGDNITLTASVSGGTWNSNHPSIATITNGLVSGLNMGTATITYTVTDPNGCSATATHPVEVVAPQTLLIAGKDTIEVNDVETYMVNANASGGTWTSTELSIADISSQTASTATLTAKSPGTTLIVYTSNSACAESVSKTIVVVEKNNGEIMGINELTPSLNTQLFPNPTNKWLTIEYFLPYASIMTIHITDMNGKIVQTIRENGLSGKNLLTIDISGFSSGVYLMKLSTENTTSTMKFTKNQ